MYDKIMKLTALRIIEILLDGRKTLTEISDLTGISKPTLQQKYLNEMESEKVIEKEIVRNNTGREAFYSLRPYTIHISLDPEHNASLIYSCNEGIENGRSLLGQVSCDRFRKNLEVIINHIISTDDDTKPDLVILFGSVARDEGTMKSDLDLLFIKEKWSKKEKKNFINLLSGISYKLDYRVESLFVETNEFIKNRKGIYDEIRKEGKIIFENQRGGGEDVWSEMMRYRSISI
jgi:predicted nucleotidyltransferase